METTFIFSIAILIMSVVVHEVSHGFLAYFLGDPTAKLAGRLTLNPVKHIDPIGSILVPGILALLPGGLILGWAKPVPFNPYNLRGGKWGPAIVALAGPFSNLLIALVFGLILQFGAGSWLNPATASLVFSIVVINVMLALFNLTPVAPFDGSKLLYAILPDRTGKVERFMEANQLWLFVLVILVVGSYLEPATMWLAKILAGA